MFRQHFDVRPWLIFEMFGMVVHFPGNCECFGLLLFLCAHMGLSIFLGVPLGTENYFQSPGNIPTRTSQFLQATRCPSVVLLVQWQVLVLRVSKHSWMFLLGFCLFVMQHSTTTPWDSLTLLSPVLFRSSQYQHAPPLYLTTVFHFRAVVQCNLQVGTGALPPLRPILVRHHISSSLVLRFP